MLLFIKCCPSQTAGPRYTSRAKVYRTSVQRLRSQSPLGYTSNRLGHRPFGGQSNNTEMYTTQSYTGGVRDLQQHQFVRLPPLFHLSFSTYTANWVLTKCWNFSLNSASLPLPLHPPTILFLLFMDVNWPKRHPCCEWNRATNFCSRRCDSQHTLADKDKDSCICCSNLSEVSTEVTAFFFLWYQYQVARCQIMKSKGKAIIHVN